jgi:hypothetical protein
MSEPHLLDWETHQIKKNSETSAYYQWRAASFRGMLRHGGLQR